MEHDDNYCEKCPLNNFCSAQREDDESLEENKIDLYKAPDATRLPLCKKCPFKKGDRDIVLVIPISMN